MEIINKMISRTEYLENDDNKSMPESVATTGLSALLYFEAERTKEIGSSLGQHFERFQDINGWQYLAIAGVAIGLLGIATKVYQSFTSRGRN